MRTSAEAAIVVEVEVFKRKEYQLAIEAIEASMSESKRDYAVVQEKVATAATQVSTATAQRGEIERAITILQATRKQLIADITAS